EDSESELTVERVKASAAAVTEATGLELGSATAEDAAGFPAGIAAWEAPKAKRDSSDAEAPIARPKRAEPLADTVALAVNGSAQLASIATARAAGIPVHLVPEGSANPQAHASVIEALSTSETTKTLAIGAEFAAQPALD